MMVWSVVSRSCYYLVFVPFLSTFSSFQAGMNKKTKYVVLSGISSPGKFTLLLVYSHKFSLL